MYQVSLPSLLWTALTLSLSVGLAAPVRADVTLSGGSPAQRKALQRLYDHSIPAPFRHADEAVPVDLLTDREMNAAGSEDAAAAGAEPQDVDGIYSDETGGIQIRASLSSEDLARTFAHEYGHHVWQALPRSERRLYSRIYRQQREAGKLVSDYAGENRDEGFAEAFAFFVTDRPTLDLRDPASSRFLQALLSGQGTVQDAPAAQTGDEGEYGGYRSWAGQRGGGHGGHWHRQD